MPTDPGFWSVLLDDLTPGAKIIVLALIVISLLGVRALKILDRKLDTAKEQATLAAKRSKPTGNGFAAEVQSKLDALLAGQNKANKRIKRLEEFGRQQHPDAAHQLDTHPEP